MAYKLQLPESSRIHPIFHVSQLKRVIGDHPVEATLPASLEVDVGSVFDPDTVLQTRVRSAAHGDIREVSVQWKGRESDEATWVELEEFRGQFPSFRLEDKTFSEGEEVDVQRSTDEETEQEEGVAGEEQVEQRFRKYYVRRTKDAGDVAA